MCVTRMVHDCDAENRLQRMDRLLFRFGAARARVERLARTSAVDYCQSLEQFEARERSIHALPLFIRGWRRAILEMVKCSKKKSMTL